MKQLKKILIKNRLYLLFLTIFLLSVSVTKAENKVVVIPLFDSQKPSGPPAPVPRTGQNTSYETRDDGDLEKGVAWPNPRFKDNGDGTVTDRLTGLIWMKNANCFDQRTWAEALSDCNTLADGTCGLTDGSAAGEWHLVNIKELQSLVDHGSYDPTLPNTAGTGKWTEGDAFTGVQSAGYWSSTTILAFSSDVLYVHLYFGGAFNSTKTVANYVWCVRGGQ